MPRQSTTTKALDASHPLRRRIFTALRDSKRPLTTAELADLLDAHIATIANTCSMLETAGALERPDGPRNGYAVVRPGSMLPDDARTLACLFAAYGGLRLHVEIALLAEAQP